MYGDKHRTITLPTGNKKLSWWEKDSFYNYPTLLLSAFYGLPFGDLREDFGIGKEVLLMADSGGFQQLTQKTYLNPIKVLEWQELVCDIGFIFDHPVMPTDYNEVVEHKQKRTVENAQLALKNRSKESKMKLYGVLQGHKYEEKINMMKMYNGILNQFDGFAAGGFGVLSSNLPELTKSLTMSFKVFQDYQKPIHMFGLSGERAMIILTYLSKVYNKNVTYDSSSYSSGSHYMEYEMSNRNMTLSFGRENRNTTIDRLPCTCPVCSVVKTLDDKPSNQKGSILALHNLYHTLDYAYFLNCLKEDKNKFIEFAGKINNDLLPLFEFIDLSVIDMEQALKKYSHLFKKQNEQCIINF